MLVKLKDIGKVITGKTPSTKDPLNFIEEVPFITTVDLNNGFNLNYTERFISHKGFKSIFNNTISGVSVLVNCIGSDMGNVGITDMTCATNQQINAITNIKGFCNPYYLYYCLILKKDYMRTIAGETAVPILSKSVFENIEIDLPHKDIQDKIANILSNIDNQIERNNAMTKRLQVLGNTIYSKEINKDTKYFTLKTVANITTGKEDANFASSNGKYNFYTCSEEISKCNEFAFDGNSILIAGNGNFNVKYYNGKFNAYQRTYVIQNNDLFGNIYYSSLRSIDGFSKNANGSIIKFITLGLVQDIQIPIFADKVNQVLNNIISKRNEIILETEKLNQLKNNLLPLLINGQLEI